jgi:hypothetical protein
LRAPGAHGPDHDSVATAEEPGNGGTSDIMPDNAFIEAFNGRCRAECLNAHWFLTPCRRPPKNGRLAQALQ